MIVTSLVSLRWIKINPVREKSLSLRIIFATLIALIIALFAHVTAQAQTQVTVVSSASYGGTALATEEIAVAFGSGMASATAVATATPLPTVMGGTSIKVRDSAGTERLAPLFFVSPNQINFQIPTGTANGAATVRVFINTGVASTGTVQIAAVAPGLFSADASGRGLAAGNVIRQKANNTQSWEIIGQYDTQQGKFVAVPVDLGAETDQLFLILYGTGLRKHSGLINIKATIGGANAEVLFAGSQGSFDGLDQVNLKIPRSLTRPAPSPPAD